MQTKLLRDLKENRTPYLRRGWCLAEMRWSELRARPNTVVVVDKKQPNKAQSAPWAPETFKEELERKDDAGEWFYKFTHRDDMAPVLESYRQAFVAKALGIPVLDFSQLPSKEVRILGRALAYYQNLKTIKLAESMMDEEGAKLLNDGLKMLPGMIYVYFSLFFYPKFERVTAIHSHTVKVTVFGPSQPAKIMFDECDLKTDNYILQRNVSCFNNFCQKAVSATS